MFGNAPRALWERWCPADDRGRIALSCRALLVEEGDRRVLLETGIGGFMSPEMRDRYGVVESDHVLLESLRSAGLTDADIDVVILSHLHFDHAGGLLAPYAPERPPELLFPNARFVVGRDALARAEHPHPRDRASFIPDLPRLLEDSGRLVILDAPGDLNAAVGERFTAVRSDGHTPGMILTTVTGTHQSVFFCADLVPGTPWIHLPITMGYDRFAERLVDEKSALFAGLEKDDQWLFFTHDTQYAAAKLERDERRRYRAREAKRDSEWILDLDAPPA